MGNNIKITDNSKIVLNDFGRKIAEGLFAVGSTAEKYAKANLTNAGRVDTGRLRNSVTFTKDDANGVVYVGTNVEYAPYIEYGTGIYADAPFIGRGSAWMVYPDGAGKYKTPFWTYGVQPSHFLRNAVSDHAKEYEDMLKVALRK